MSTTLASYFAGKSKSYYPFFFQMILFVKTNCKNVRKIGKGETEEM